MAEFTFGQVEATLAAINNIADHKRVAFAGRLKFLQKNGLLGRERDRPGRGKAGAFAFPQMMRFALGVELLKFGLPPQRAAQLVDRNWNGLQYSIYLATFTEYEVAERAEEHGFDPRATTWIWLVRDDALAELTTAGASEFDTYEAIEVVELQGLQTTLDMMGSLLDAGERRSMLINGTALTRTVLNQIAFGFRFATIEAMLADILKELADFTELMGEIGEIMGKGPDLTVEQKANLHRSLREAIQTDHSTNPPTPPAVLKQQAAELIARLTPAARELLKRMAHARHVELADPDEAESIIELVRAGLFAPELPASEDAPPKLESTPLGAAAMRIFREKEGSENVGS